MEKDLIVGKYKFKIDSLPAGLGIFSTRSQAVLRAAAFAENVLYRDIYGQTFLNIFPIPFQILVPGLQDLFPGSKSWNPAALDLARGGRWP